jgi:hypothetical protein
LGAGIRSTAVSGLGQSRQIVCETLSPISKITRATWTGGVAQAIEHLLCKCEALNSNPNLKKKKNHWQKKLKNKINGDIPCPQIGTINIVTDRVVRVVECLPSKCSILAPVVQKKKKKERKKRLNSVISIKIPGSYFLNINKLGLKSI